MANISPTAVHTDALEHSSSPSTPTLYQNAKRTGSFWLRVVKVYWGYKVAQVRAFNLRQARVSEEVIQARLWVPHHTWAGLELYRLSIDLKGFYLKTGQFLGARSDFIPEPICRQLVKLQDQVPPMDPAQTRDVICSSLGITDLYEAFQDINLEKPLGSATIAQVHKALLRREVNGIRDVAVKVQYPGALDTMLQDLANIRLAAEFLQNTELKFDLVSPVDELAKQIRMEFDFVNEANVMDAIASNLQSMAGEVDIPVSVPGLVSKQVLVMSYVDGLPITRAQELTAGRSEMQKAAGSRLVFGRIMEAYGRMLLQHGLFQADVHPGNILLRQDGSVALLDFGQAKQLSEQLRLGFARLIIALSAAGDAPLMEVRNRLTRQQQSNISVAMDQLGIETEEGPVGLRIQMGYGMFDTRGRISPFAKDSPLKAMAVKRFPPDLFFVLRVVQLLRGLGNAMGIEDQSVAVQWLQLAQQVVLQEDPGQLLGSVQVPWAWLGGLLPAFVGQRSILWWRTLRQPLPALAAAAPSWLRQGHWVAPAWRASYSLAAAGLVYGFLRVPLAQQLPLLAWTLASAGCQLLWSHGLFARQDLLGGLVLGSASTYALWRLVTLLQLVSHMASLAMMPSLVLSCTALAWLGAVAAVNPRRSKKPGKRKPSSKPLPPPSPAARPAVAAMHSSVPSGSSRAQQAQQLQSGRRPVRAAAAARQRRLAQVAGGRPVQPALFCRSAF